MSAFDTAEGRILIALFIAHHGERRKILTWEELEAHYHTNVSKMQFEAIVDELQQSGVAKVFRDKDGSGVLLLDHGVRFAHDKILRFLNADTFEVNWKTERILTDGSKNLDVPCPNGWMLLHAEKVAEAGDSAPPEPQHSETVELAVPPRLGAGEMAAKVEALSRPPESNWVKWQTVLAALGVLIAIATIFVGSR